MMRGMCGCRNDIADYDQIIVSNENNILVHSLTTARMLARRFTEDLQPHEYLHRATPKGNCAAWLLGHLIVSNHRTAQRFNSDLPALPDGFETHFARDENAPHASEFGDCSKLIAMLELSFDALIAAVQRATPEQLAAPIDKPMPVFKNAGELANFMALHAAVHIGQITMIRRSLGRPPII
jgi:hypothetical protein